MSIIYRYTRDIKMSEDLLQDSYVKIFRNLNQFDVSKGHFESWSSKIAVNTALQYLRKKKDLLMEQIPESVFDFESNIDDQLTVSELKETIDKLPEVHRVILNMYYYENYNHKEISEILGIQQSTSRSQLARARMLLQSKWTNLNTTGL